MRRPTRAGWSRVLPALLALTLLVVLADLAGAPLGPLRDVGTAVLGPVERVVAPRSDAGDRSAEATRLGQRVRDLEDDAATGEQLRDLLASPAAEGRRLVPGRVVGLGRGGASGPHRVTVDVGRRDGVRTSSAVIAPDGLVGRVVSVAEWTSDVEVLGSPATDVGVRVGAKGVIGSLTGSDPTTSRSAGELVVTSVARDRVAEGDEVVTLGSPSSRPYPPGIPVGRVSSVAERGGRLTDTAVVEPAVDVASVDVVAVVVRSPRETPREPAEGTS